tara:strand:+ start:3000 stop:4019 length:1020 start_codon:yes stop_codon:yes gene_type:complete
MRIAIIGPGVGSTIPPKGWGAVEIFCHYLRVGLEQHGNEVTIINTGNKGEIIRLTNECQADFVHIQYDDHIDVAPHLTCKNIAITNHYAYLEQTNWWAIPGAPHSGWAHHFHRIASSTVDIIALTPGVASVYQNFGVDPSRIHVVKNGVRNDLFVFEDVAEHPDRTIYLAKIDYRKRQFLFQSIPELYYAGNIEQLHQSVASKRFDTTSSNYLGEWTKDYLYSNLTKYANLALLSDGEVSSAVILEALAAGCGVVISEFAIGNLDTNLPFIDVIPEEKMKDISFIRGVLQKNREISVIMRKEIRAYATNNFSYDQIIRDEYIPCIKKIIEKNSIETSIV